MDLKRKQQIVTPPTSTKKNSERAIDGAIGREREKKKQGAYYVQTPTKLNTRN